LKFRDALLGTYFKNHLDFNFFIMKLFIIKIISINRK
jgi:hypothetical protein